MEGRKCQVHKTRQLERPLDDDHFHFDDGVEDDGDGNGGDDHDGVEDDQDDGVELVTIMLMAMRKRGPSCRW